MTRNNIVRFPGVRERQGGLPAEGGRTEANEGRTLPGVEQPVAAPRTAGA